MVPDKSDQKWKDLITGKIQHQFRPFSVGMILSRINRDIRINKKEDADLSKYVEELHDFFSKYEDFLEEDIKEIFE